MTQLYKTATVAPGRTPPNLAIYGDTDQYQSLYVGAHVFDLVNGYGCDPTGAVECSAKVNQAFTDAAASGVSALVTGYGTLLVGHTVKCFSDNVALIGQGAGHPDHMLNGLRFKATASFPDSRILDFSQSGTPTKPLSGVLMQNVSVDGNNHSGTAVDGIYFSAHDSLMDFCHVTYCTGWGIRVAGVGTWTTYNTLVRACRVRACDSGGFYFDTASTDSHDQECWSFYNGLTDVAGSTVRNANADGMLLTSSGHQSYGYHAYSNTGHGFDTQGVSASQMTGAYLENNGKAGFYVDNAVAGVSGFRFSNSYVWANSTVTNAAFSNVQLGSAAHGSSVIVTGCHVQAGSNTNKPAYGIDFPNGSAAQNCIAAANIVSSGYATGAIHSNGNSGAGTACFVYGNQGWNPVGAVTAPGIPATTVATNPGAYPTNEAYTVYMNGGASTNVTVIAIAGTTTGLTLGANGHVTFRVMQGQSVTLTYGAGAGPTSWVWMAD